MEKCVGTAERRMTPIIKDLRGAWEKGGKRKFLKSSETWRGKPEVNSERGKMKRRSADTIERFLPAKALKEVNLALLEGLKLSVQVMKNWDQLEEDRRESFVRSVDRLIEETEIIYQTDKSQKRQLG
jgi:hypothetical protein